MASLLVYTRLYSFLRVFTRFHAKIRVFSRKPRIRVFTRFCALLLKKKVCFFFQKGGEKSKFFLRKKNFFFVKIFSFFLRKKIFFFLLKISAEKMIVKSKGKFFKLLDFFKSELVASLLFLESQPPRYFLSLMLIIKKNFFFN